MSLASVRKASECNFLPKLLRPKTASAAIELGNIRRMRRGGVSLISYSFSFPSSFAEHCKAVRIDYPDQKQRFEGKNVSPNTECQILHLIAISCGEAQKEKDYPNQLGLR